MSDTKFRISSRLGFGCASLMSRVGHKDSLRLLQSAFDAGITHFDTARMYGYGESETVLGEFLTGRRHEVTVTTKVGIMPPRRSRAMSVIKPAVRWASAMHPKLRATVQRRGQGIMQVGMFDLQTLEASLVTSLRRLRVDYVDMLLLHEAREPVLRDENVLKFLEQARACGLVRAYGLATDLDTTREAIANNSPLTEVLQIPNSAFDQNLVLLKPSTESLVLTHSALGSSFEKLCTTLADNSVLALRWSDALGFKATNSAELGRLFLASAIEANPSGVVLFSTSKPTRIAENVRLLVEKLPIDQINILRELALEIAPSLTSR